MGEPAEAAVPIQVRATMAHAALQHLADQEGLDVLHIKGAAITPGLVRSGRTFTDADVLVRPGHAAALLRQLTLHHWRLVNAFAHSSPFEHSATLQHDQWGPVDLHRLFPGLGPDPTAAFDRLWSTCHEVSLAGVDCSVPDEPSQALILLLHAARSPASAKAVVDIEELWEKADDAQRAAIRERVDEHGAQLAFSVILDELQAHAADPGYDLWKVVSRGGTRSQEWWARVKAAPRTADKVAILLRAPLVNVEHLELVRGRPITRAEVAREFVVRPARGLAQEFRRARLRLFDRSRGGGNG